MKSNKTLTFPDSHLVLSVTPKVLGKGQFGTVYYAFDKHSHIPFAVKCIDRKKLKARDLKNLQNEIQIMVEIRSENVIALKDATKTKNNFYLVMELCNGGDLD